MKYDCLYNTKTSFWTKFKHRIQSSELLSRLERCHMLSRHPCKSCTLSSISCHTILSHYVVTCGHGTSVTHAYYLSSLKCDTILSHYMVSHVVTAPTHAHALSSLWCHTVSSHFMVSHYVVTLCCHGTHFTSILFCQYFVTQCCYAFMLLSQYTCSFFGIFNKDVDCRP